MATSKQAASIKKLIADNKQALENKGVVTIHIDYAGSGDEGYINDVVFLDGEDSDAAGEIKFDDPDFRHTLEGLVEELIEDIHGGYENNDGGGGDIYVSVSNGKILYSSYDYVTNRSNNDDITL